MEFRVEPSCHGWTLTAFLKKCFEGLSSKQIKKSLEAKACTVNGVIQTFASYQLMEGDLVVYSGLSQRKTLPIILFEDDFILVFNKPAGLVSDAKAFEKALGKWGKQWFLVHRLDKETSGVMVLAKSKSVYESLVSQFTNRKVQKKYVALLEGKLTPKMGRIETYLGPAGRYQGGSLYGSVKSGGRRALTLYNVLEQKNRTSLALIEIMTGRTHQIRVHMSEKGHPVIGDHLYGNQTGAKAIEVARQLLHALELSFMHPQTQELCQFRAELSIDFQEILTKLGYSYIC